jgi:hypothetical protein
VSNLLRSLWLWVCESKSRDYSSESNSRLEFEKHVGKVFSVRNRIWSSVVQR